VVPSGKVLLAGGSLDGTTATADVFTLNAIPANSTVAATGAMSDKRLGHSATLLTSCPSPVTGPCVLVAGGNVTSGKTWEIYDASANNFPLNTATGGSLVRQFHAAAAFANGKVVLAGGNN